MATTGGGGAGAVRVSGLPSGGVSGAGALADGAGADDVGSVIDFLSGAGFVGVAFLSQARRASGLKEQIYSTLGAQSQLRKNRSRSGRRTHNPYLRLVRSPLGIGAPATRPAASAAAMACSSTVSGERPCSSAARSRSSNSGVTCQIVPW